MKRSRSDDHLAPGGGKLGPPITATVATPQEGTYLKSRGANPSDNASTSATRGLCLDIRNKTFSMPAWVSASQKFFVPGPSAEPIPSE
jgi:hypothetical protein